MKKQYTPVAQVCNSEGDTKAQWGMFALLVLVTLFCCLPHDALADTTTTASSTGGDALWASFKSVVFGGWGLLAAALIAICGIYTAVNKTLGQGIIVLAVGFVLFLIPALMVAAMKAGQSMAT